MTYLMIALRHPIMTVIMVTLDLTAINATLRETPLIDMIHIAVTVEMRVQGVFIVTAQTYEMTVQGISS